MEGDGGGHNQDVVGHMGAVSHMLSLFLASTPLSEDAVQAIHANLAQITDIIRCEGSLAQQAQQQAQQAQQDLEAEKQAQQSPPSPPLFSGGGMPGAERREKRQKRRRFADFPPSPSLVSGRRPLYHGVCDEWLSSLNYGFIRWSPNQDLAALFGELGRPTDKIFVHKEQIQNAGWLKKGTKVSFDVEWSQRKKKYYAANCYVQT